MHRRENGHIHQTLSIRPIGVPTIVNLNSIMVDGTGMCGACWVEVGRQTRFACVDSPGFGGHHVDWDLLMARQRMYLNQEPQAMERRERERRIADCTGKNS